MAPGVMRGPMASTLFLATRVATDETMENVSGGGAGGGRDLGGQETRSRAMCQRHNVVDDVVAADGRTGHREVIAGGSVGRDDRAPEVVRRRRCRLPRG